MEVKKALCYIIHYKENCQLFFLDKCIILNNKHGNYCSHLIHKDIEDVNMIITYHDDSPLTLKQISDYLDDFSCDFMDFTSFHNNLKSLLDETAIYYVEDVKV